jgi:hypothetical protein
MSFSVACQSLKGNHCASTILARTILDLERAVQNVFEWRNLIGNFMQAAKPFRSVALDEFLRVFEEYYLRSCWGKVVDTLYLVLGRANDAINGYSAYGVRFDPDPRLDSSIDDSLCDYRHVNVSSWLQLQANCEWSRVRI